MPKDKEWSAVAALLNEINKLRERVEFLERLIIPSHSVWISQREQIYDAPQYFYSTNTNTDTVPLADVRITDDWYTRTATYCWTYH